MRYAAMSSLAVPQPMVMLLVMLIAIAAMGCGFLFGRRYSQLGSAHWQSAQLSVSSSSFVQQLRERLDLLENVVTAKEQTVRSHPLTISCAANSFSPAASSASCPAAPSIGARVQAAVLEEETDHSDVDFSHLTLWSTDYHITPIADLKFLFSSFGIRIIDKSLSGACKSMGTCATDLKVLSGGNGYHLGDHPERLSKQLFQAYQSDPEFQAVDGIVCFHPIATCQLYLPFNKSLLFISSTRYEHGQDQPADWQHFNRILQLASHNPRHLVAGNSAYDADYIRYFTNIDAAYIPSFCGQITARYGKEGEKRRPEILLGHMHVSANLASYWGGGLVWEPMRAGLNAAQRRLPNSSRAASLVFKGINELYGRYEYQDLANHPCIVHLPYQVSVMSMFEQYRMNIPLFYPSLPFLVRLQQEHAVLSERTWARVYGKGQALKSDIPAHPSVYWPDPNNDRDTAPLQFWLSKADFYVKPHIVYYDSWDDLLSKLSTINLAAVSAAMRQENDLMEAKLKRQWKGLLYRMFKDRPEGGYAMPSSYEEAMRELWGLEVKDGTIVETWKQT